VAARQRHKLSRRSRADELFWRSDKKGDNRLLLTSKREEIVLNRRAFFQSAAATAGTLVAAPAFAQSKADPQGTTPPPRNWRDPASAAYPDAAFEVFDPRMVKLSAGPAGLRRVAWDLKFTEGPVYFADMHRLIWSDIPANKMYEYNELTGETHVFRDPSNHANGNSRDWQGRLLTCEQGSRRVTRTEYDGRITVIADSFQGKRLNSPNGIIAKKDGTLWFTDPTYGILLEHQGSARAEPELPSNVYMFDPKSGKLSVAIGDFNQPNGLCFSPDEKQLYITDTGVGPFAAAGPQHSWIRIFDVGDDNKLKNGKVFHDLRDMPGGIADDIRVDIAGNLWAAGGWADKDKNFNGVSVYAPDGTPIGRIVLPEVAANLCFGGPEHNTLYIAASTSIYAIGVNTRGVEL
jgi:gluconolactonase